MKMFRLFVFFALTTVMLWWSSASAFCQELKVGQPAPNFTLRGTDGATYKLSEFKGKQAVVLAWFPKAFTGGCTAECKSMRDSASAIRGYNVSFFAISVDDKATNKKFADNLQLPFPILSDPNRTTAKEYGVLGMNTRARRWTFYIGKDGTILDIDKAVKPESAGADLQADLSKLGVAKR